MSSKKKKVRGKVVSLSEFLGTDNSGASSIVVAPKTSSWADESEDHYDDKSERFVLPTAPRTARAADIDPERIPKNPPYTAYIANLPFEVDNDEIERFFQGCKVLSIRLPREGGETGRFKGFGYVEFETRQDLVDGLEKNEDSMRSRSIRVDVAEGDGNNMKRSGDRGDRGGGGRERDDEIDRSGGVVNWRSAPAGGDARPSFRDNDRSPPRGGSGGGGGGGSGGGGGGFEDRQRDRGGFGDRDRDRGGGFGDRDRDRGGGFGDRDRDRGGGFGDRDRDRGGGFGDRDRDRGGSSSFGDRNRDRGGGFGDRDRDRGGGFGDRDRDRGGGYGDRDRDRGGSYGDRDRGGRFGGSRDSRDGGTNRFNDGGGYKISDRDEGDKWRPERSGGRDRGGGGSERSGSGGPGGGGEGDDSGGPRERRRLQLKPRTKPVEENKEGEAEGADEAQEDTSTQSSSGIFGSAKPVNTAAREQEIEKKIKHPSPPPARKEIAAAPSGNIFGAAKPVDTAAREREIEAKLYKSDGPSKKDERPEEKRNGQVNRGDRERNDGRDGGRRFGGGKDDRFGGGRDDRFGGGRDDRFGGGKDDRFGGGGGGGGGKDDRRRDEPPYDSSYDGPDDRNIEGARVDRENDSEPKKESQPPPTVKKIPIKKEEECVLDMTNKFAFLNNEEEDE